MLILLLRHSPCFQACTEPQRSPFNTPESCKRTLPLPWISGRSWGGDVGRAFQAEQAQWAKDGRCAQCPEHCPRATWPGGGHLVRERPEWSAAQQVKQGFVGHCQEFVLNTSNTKCYRCHHFFRYMRINVELWCAPETHIISYVGYSFYKKIF